MSAEPERRVLDVPENIQSPPAGEEEWVFPCSFAQERLWVIDQLHPGSTHYNIFIVVRLAGLLDRTAMLNSIRTIVRRHESLRTVFREVDGIPVQVVRESGEIDFEWLKRHSSVEEQKERQVRFVTRREADRPFDLQKGPMLRVRLLEFGELDHALIVSMHHIASDGWSLGVMVREFSVLYGAYVKNEPSPLPELEIQYADYAIWQREWLQGEILDQQMEYWRNKLAGASTLDLPTDYPRSAKAEYEGATVWLDVPPEFANKVRELGRLENATLFMVLLAAFDLVLAHYSGQNDISVGTAIANRTHKQIEELIGFFVNTLVLRTDLSGNPSVRELLARVRTTTIEAYAHQDLSFEKLVAELHPDRELGRTPLFQAMLVMQNARRHKLQLPKLKVTSIRPGEGRGKFELLLSVREMEDGGLNAELEYANELFERKQIEHFLAHWQLALEKMTGEPARRIHDLDLLTAAERQAISSWNHTNKYYSQNQNFLALFYQRSREGRDCVALECNGQYVTREALERKATQLARFLQNRGIGTESRVGICLDRGPDLILSILGTMMAGAAYVPLDARYPTQRLRVMIEEAAVSTVLTHHHFAAHFSGSATAAVFLSQHRSQIAQQASGPLDAVIHPESLACVIFTSGSTGTPKAVGVEHRSLTNQLAWASNTLELLPEDHVLQKTSISFDASLMETLLPLSAGATVVIARPGGEYDSDYLLRLMVEQSVTYADLSPVHLEEIVRRSASQDLKALRVIVSGGDVLNPTVARQCAKNFPAKLFNMYGPTETTIQSTFFLCTGESIPRIGKPIANTQAYILNSRFQLVGIRVPGELFLGGIGVARGYLNQPVLTAEKFLPDPFSSVPGMRFYRTGDRARWHDDGELEFLGRLDQQVKIRGIRIELGEIESALVRHSGVKQAAVALREDGENGRQLVAYVVGKNAKPPSPGELKKYLKERLPEPMVPARYVFLKEMPLTSGGKIDRNVLPQPEQKREEHVEPATPEEQSIACIFLELLKADRVGAEDSFFALGGHSLLATQLISRLRHVFGVELPLRSVFEFSTPRELAARILEAQRFASAQVPPIVPAERKGRLPLSYAQQRLWFLDQLERGNAAYNMILGLRLQGKTKVAALKWSLNEIVKRHEILRSRFPEVEGNAVLEILEELPLAVEQEDFSCFPEQEQQKLVQQSLEEEAVRPFDLTSGPLLRASLLYLSAEEHVLIVSVHHIVCDGWSFGIMVKEFSTLYRAATRGEKSTLPAMPVQYVDFAIWQRKWLQGSKLTGQLGYWKKQLAEAPVLELPTDFPRPAVMTYRGDMLGFTFPAPLLDRLKSQGQRQGLTLFMSLLAGFSIVLSRYSGQTDVVVGTPIAGRNRFEIEGLIGFFANTLVLRSRLRGLETISDFLRHVRETALAAYRHQDLPFEKLVEELQPERDLSRTPLFQTMLILQNTADSELRLPDLRISGLQNAGKKSKFDLTLTFIERRDGSLSGELEYLTDIFSRERILLMVEHLGIVLEQIAQEPQKNLLHVEMLTTAEKDQILRKWNRTEIAFPLKGSSVELLEAQAALTPDAIAVDFKADQLSYAELNARANQMGHYLRKHYVQPESRIGLYTERSLEMLIAMIAVWKAGAAYVPLDSAYPEERLRYIVEIADVHTVLAQDDRAGMIFGEMAIQLLNILHLEPRLQVESRKNPEVRVSCDHLAYVLFTSGSTGLPKGVEIAHDGVMNHLFSMRDELEICAEDRVIAITTLSFDIALLELYLPLTVGAKILLLSRDVAIDGHHLLQEVMQGATVMQATPATWRLLLQAGWKRAPGFRVWCGGEALPPEIADLLQERTESVWNLYGPTETTVWALVEKLSDERPITIGRPIANTYLYVLDHHMRPVPRGVYGELYIGGICVGRGYSNQPELTAERFLPDAFSGKSGARIYKTGDIVRYRFDGKVEYHGRNDHQIKLRGHRIELGEIEAALQKMPEISEAKVLVREGQQGDQRLVAFVMAEGERHPRGEDLRRFLQGKLPDYMVPGSYLFLNEFPVTNSGKIDRKALLAMEAGEQDQEYTQPQTPIEEIIAGIWSSVLGKERVGLNDNFFDHGGYSLLATQVVSRLRHAFHLDIPVRLIFEAPTVNSLAQCIKQLRQTAIVVPTIQRASRQKAVPLSVPQERLWFLDRLDSGSSAYNMPFALRMAGTLDKTALAQSVNGIVARHEILRTTFHMDGQTPVQSVTPSLAIHVSQADLSLLDAETRMQEAARIRKLEAEHSFHLEQGPLIRFYLIILESEEHILLANMHHIVSDAWSLGVMVRELSSLYNAFVAGNESPLAPLTIQYGDFAIWQREWLKGETLQQELAYWRNQLKGATVLDLPTDYRHQGTLVSAGDKVEFDIAGELLERAQQFSREHGFTLFMLLLAALDLVLSRYSGQKDIVIGTDSANRGRIEVEDMVGFYTNQLALRVDLSGSPTVLEFLERVRTVCLDAYEHQNVPFENVLEELQPRRSRAPAPLFPVKFAFENVPQEEIRLAGLETELLPELATLATMDLTLYLWDLGDRLKAALEYRVKAFRRSSAEKIAQHLVEMLAAMLSSPNESIDALAFSSDKEQDNLMAAFLSNS